MVYGIYGIYGDVLPWIIAIVMVLIQQVWS